MLSADDIVAIIRPVKERAGDDAWRAALARLGGEVEVMPAEDHDRTWPPPTVDPKDDYWQWCNLEKAAAHGPFKATKLYELQDRVSLKVEGRRYYSLTQIWREHRPR